MTDWLFGRSNYSILLIGSQSLKYLLSVSLQEKFAKHEPTLFITVTPGWSLSSVAVTVHVLPLMSL